MLLGMAFIVATRKTLELQGFIVYIPEGMGLYINSKSLPKLQVGIDIDADPVNDNLALQSAHRDLSYSLCDLAFKNSGGSSISTRLSYLFLFDQINFGPW